MDYERALVRVNEFAGWCERAIWIQQNSDSGFSLLPEWGDLKERITEGLPLVQRIAQEIDPSAAALLRTPDPILEYNNKLAACRELRGIIQTQEEGAEILGPQGPKLAAEDLHPWVWDHAAQLWSDGYRRAAVQAAATALFDSHVPAKLGRQRDTRGGTDLMGQAFSIRPPEPDAPRLRFTEFNEGTPEWTSAHEGAMKLGQGAAQAIRNLSTHDLSEPEEQEALEMLAVLSYVARLVDKAQVVTP
jgi:hypothetical protein